ncbi:cytochrome ubiquinol oxidase subunit I [Methylacidiphilum caldifontis]|uniref:cytochrome ubiquinol oxidase subunit I n=1 Tax=Methylacidiphilum caldifontis TaxID=2795386 RepID=UPI001ABC77A6|nr:cytochrome ubiquinol oxidase subunit I [Methylacidiphilum caldifontis]
MGLALFLALFQTAAIVWKDPLADRAFRFWSKIFAINFVFGVVTGIVMEFEFGTNWSSFSKFAEETVGQLLAMEGTFAFFLESSFLGIMLFGRKRVGKGLQLLAAWMVFLGSWISAYFIISADAWMQHPVGYTVGPDGIVHLDSLLTILLNPWAWKQFAHNMAASVVTSSFVVAAVGAFYLLSGFHSKEAAFFLRWGVRLGFHSTILVIFPTGDWESRQVFAWQPTKASTMEGLFKTEKRAPFVLIGQPNLQSESLDNPIFLPGLLSFLTYHRFAADVKGLDAFPRNDWPDNIPLVYYAYHIMVGLGTIFSVIMVISALFMALGRLDRARWLLWAILLTAPFPYIANTAGWITAEARRQP